MAKKILKERERVKNLLLKGFKNFYSKFYGSSDTVMETEALKKFEEVLDFYINKDYEDFDIEVNVKYQREPIGSKNVQVKYKKPKSICAIADDTISLPHDVTMFTIYAKPVIRQRANNLVNKKTLNNAMFEQKVVVVRDNEFDNYPKNSTKFNVPENVQVLSFDELNENCELINFVKPDEVKL